MPAVGLLKEASRLVGVCVFLMVLHIIRERTGLPQGDRGQLDNPLDMQTLDEVVREGAVQRGARWPVKAREREGSVELTLSRLNSPYLGRSLQASVGSAKSSMKLCLAVADSPS